MDSEEVRMDSEEEMIYVSKEEFDTLYEIALENKEKYKSKVQENKQLKASLEDSKAEVEQLKNRIKELEEELHRSSTDVSLSSVPLNYFL